MIVYGNPSSVGDDPPKYPLIYIGGAVWLDSLLEAVHFFLFKKTAQMDPRDKLDAAEAIESRRNSNVFTPGPDVGASHWPLSVHLVRWGIKQYLAVLDPAVPLRTPPSFLEWYVVCEGRGGGEWVTIIFIGI